MIDKQYVVIVNRNAYISPIRHIVTIHNPYVMLYNKEEIPKGHKLRKLQRWVNNRIIFAKCKNFEEYEVVQG